MNARLAAAVKNRARQLRMRQAASRNPIGWALRNKAIYDGLAQLSDRHGLADHHLAAAELRVFSQNGEDGVIAALLAKMDVDPFFIEFGVESGSQGNCVLLADVLGWPGVFLERDPVLYPLLHSKYEGNQRVLTQRAHVTPANVNDLFRGAGVPAEPAIVSIDVDGQDYWIWKALDCVQPAIVVIEYNAALPAHEPLVEPLGGPRVAGRSRGRFMGASIGALAELASSKGYVLAHLELTGVNAFFVRDDLKDAVPQGPIVPRVHNPYFMWPHMTGTVRPSGFVRPSVEE